MSDPEIDARIKQLLDGWSYVSPEMLTELPEDQREQALKDFFTLHRGEFPVVMKGNNLVTPEAAASGGSGKQQQSMLPELPTHPLAPGQGTAQVPPQQPTQPPQYPAQPPQPQPPQQSQPPQYPAQPPQYQAQQPPSYPAKQPPPYPTQPQPYQPYPQTAYVKPPPRFGSLKGLSTGLQVALWIGIGVNVLVLVLMLVLATGGIYRDASRAASFIGIPLSLWLIAFTILMLIWVYRASSNLRAFGIQGLKYTPGMSVVWFIIPIANFFMPILVLREIWRGSDPQTDSTGNAQSTKAPGLTGFWLLLEILAALVFVPGEIMLSVGAATGGDRFLPAGLHRVSDTAKAFVIGGSILRALLYTAFIIFAVLYFSKITRWQQERAVRRGLVQP